MKNRIHVFLLLVLSFFGCKHSEEPSQKLVIATSANMQFALHDITEEFTRETEIPCQIIMGSSGKLTAQIKEGAPFDVLVSADMKYPSKIHKDGLALGEPKIYAYGNLVLWTMFENLEPSLSLLTTDSIEHIAMANPDIAPYGLAASQFLKNHGLFEKVEHKLVFGESIAQTNQFITSKSAEIGFTSISVVLSEKLKNKGKWIALSEDSYSPIAQGVVVLKRPDGSSDQAQGFQQFLFSDKARKILIRYGYDVPN